MLKRAPLNVLDTFMQGRLAEIGKRSCDQKRVRLPGR